MTGQGIAIAAVVLAFLLGIALAAGPPTDEPPPASGWTHWWDHLR